MPDAAWKAAERAIAKRLKGRRAGPLGKEGSDVVHPLWAIEVKERKDIPKWLEAAMCQSERAARPGQVPIAVLHRLGARHSNDLVLMRLADFEALHGRLAEGSSC